MVRYFKSLCLAALLGFGLIATPALAQDRAAAAAAESEATADDAAGSAGGHQMFKQRFIEGDPVWMAPVLVCLILGLAIVIERILYLNMASTNTTKLLDSVESALKSGGVDAAKDVCRNTRGPIAGIFYQGLDRAHEGVDIAEKSIVAYGGVEVSRLERNLPWISLFIALAPMLGFLGTVIGMIVAFDQIAAANNISPAIVAVGIKVALLTTVFGLIVAIILQIFYNYLQSKIDSITGQMEEASIALVDLLVRENHAKH
ncbi:MAG: MotA/TolQ/ExbB proton channel family protein [Flavobacteriales bacterium]|nr:MotA/TolQ/ExbB proton channel family protein [Flavobacteriales bacterium]